MTRFKKFATILMLISFIFATVSPAMAGGLAKITEIEGGNGAGTNNASTIYFGNYWQSKATGYDPSGDKMSPEEFNNTHYVYEGIKWRVLATNAPLDYTDSSSNKGILLLADRGLYADAINVKDWESGKYGHNKDISDENANKWETSDARNTLNNTTAATAFGADGNVTSWGSFAKDAFSDKEYAAIKDTKHTAGGENAGSDIETTDKLFLLSCEEVMNEEYGFENNGKGEPSATRKILGTDMARHASVYDNDRAAEEDGDGYYWLLRSPGQNSTSKYLVCSSGLVNDFNDVTGSDNVVRPALNLDSSQILFLSAAEGGKETVDVGDGFNLTGDGASDGWKLTLKDGSINVPTITLAEVTQEGWDVNELAATAAAAGGDKQLNIVGSEQIGTEKLSVAYSGATMGDNMYVSALLKDSSGNYVNYAKISNSAADTKTIDVSGITPANYTLCIFGEQANGYKQTDYASEFNEVGNIAVTGAGAITTLKRDYAESDLTANLSYDAELSFEAGEYDTAVTVADSQTGKITADATSGTTLTGNVTVGSGATLTTVNNFTFKGDNTIKGKLTGEGEAILTIAGGKTIVSGTGAIDGIYQLIVGDGAELTANADGITPSIYAIPNSGIVNLTGGNLIRTIRGGTINILGDLTSTPSRLQGNFNNIEEGVTLTLRSGNLTQKLSGKGSVRAIDDLAVFDEIETDLTIANTVKNFVIAKSTSPEMEGKAGAVKGKLTVEANNSHYVIVNGGELSGGVSIGANSFFNNVISNGPVTYEVTGYLNGNISSDVENSGVFRNGGLISGDIINNVGATLSNNCDLTAIGFENYAGTITGHVINNGSFTTDAATATGGIENNNVLILTGIDAALGSEITGTGTTTIDGSIKSDKKIANSITINADKSLAIGASNIGGDVTNNGTVNLKGGALDKKIDGGQLNISGEVTADASNIAARAISVDADGVVNLTGGSLGKKIYADPDPYYEGIVSGGTINIMGSVTSFAACVAGDKNIIAEGAMLTIDDKGGEIGGDISGKGKLLLRGEGIKNNKKISVDTTARDSTFINTGEISGKLSIEADEYDVMVLNGGALLGDVTVGAGDSMFMNVIGNLGMEEDFNGTIEGDLLAKSGSTVMNGGSISGGVTVEEGAVFVNQKGISDDIPVPQNGNITGVVINNGSFTTQASGISGGAMNNGNFVLACLKDSGGTAVVEDTLAGAITGSGTTVVETDAKIIAPANYIGCEIINNGDIKVISGSASEDKVSFATNGKITGGKVTLGEKVEFTAKNLGGLAQFNAEKAVYSFSATLNTTSPYITADDIITVSGNATGTIKLGTITLNESSSDGWELGKPQEMQYLNAEGTGSDLTVKDSNWQTSAGYKYTFSQAKNDVDGTEKIGYMSVLKELNSDLTLKQIVNNENPGAGSTNGYIVAGTDTVEKDLGALDNTRRDGEFTISGDTATTPVLDGKGNGGIIVADTEHGGAEGDALNLKDVTIQNFNPAVTNKDGGIVTLEDVTFKDNEDGDIVNEGTVKAKGTNTFDKGISGNGAIETASDTTLKGKGKDNTEITAKTIDGAGDLTIEGITLNTTEGGSIAGSLALDDARIEGAGKNDTKITARTLTENGESEFKNITVNVTDTANINGTLTLDEADLNGDTINLTGTLDTKGKSRITTKNATVKGDYNVNGTTYITGNLRLD
ncbi:MAG: DUF6273 domain-containing protein, partial [Synergistaceae bacterium]|nr:DUF6273 domain-containing protein [Synergistaceae bacterium]